MADERMTAGAGGGAGAGAPAGAGAGKKRSVLATRITFGALLLVIACTALGLDHAFGSAIGLGVLCAAAFVGGMRETYKILRTLGPVPWAGPAQAAAALLVLAQVFQLQANLYRKSPGLLGDAVVLGYILLFLGAQLRHEPTRERLLGTALGLCAAVYILVLGSFALKIRALQTAAAPGLGYAAVFYLILASKGTDMFAFFTGRFLGRRKMIPWISPGKTWAGFAGGLAGAVLITLAFTRWTALGTVFSWWSALMLGILIGLASVVGDLVESLMKRGAAVKDSGGLVPEFGGVLDIIDCILYVAPIVYFGILFLR